MKPTPTVLRLLHAITLLAPLFTSAIAQPPPPPPAPPAAEAAATPSATQPTFEIADVHPSPNRKNSYMSGGRLNGDRFHVRQATMVNLVSLAYGMESAKVLGGPSWLDTDRYEISAKAPAGTSDDDVKLMLRNLLADRFKLVVHNDSKPQAAFVMTAPKGSSRMKQSDGTATPGCKSPTPPSGPPPPPETPASYSCRGESMAAFAEFVHQHLPQFRQPVVDNTGLKGLWDFDLKLPFTFPRNSVDCGVTVTAIEDQLGFKLEAKTAPFPVIMVDSVNQTPTPNPPGVETVLPPPPLAAFDVAVIKPSGPDSKPNFRLAGGQVNLSAIPFSTIISLAWQIDDQMIVDPPKWLKQEKFDILAKVAPPDATAGSAKAPEIDFEDLQVMLKKLIEERFAMKWHMEDRQIDAYSLVAANPKMAKADPINRTVCKEGPGPDGKDPRIAHPILGRLLTCLNITMPEFAEQLQWRSNGYIQSPVFDSTGLTGNYDFTLSFSGFSQVGGINGYTLPQAQTADPNAASSANGAEPTGGLLLFDALKQQLGLKVEKQKHSVPMLVIDHIEQKPTDN